jgi:hydrogenase maturation protease
LSDLHPAMGFPAALKEKSSLQSYQDTASIASDTLIITLGNPLCGDDGVGVTVLETLEKSERLPKNVALQFDGSPDNLLDALLTQNYRSVIIVDSAFVQRSPGEWVRFTLQDTILKSGNPNRNISMHNTGLAEVLALSTVLKLELPDIVIYGVQPMEVKWFYGLSDAVKMAVPGISTSILEELWDERNSCE